MQAKAKMLKINHLLNPSFPGLCRVREEEIA
jgi:hypothetical protein